MGEEAGAFFGSAGGSMAARLPRVAHEPRYERFTPRSHVEVAPADEAGAESDSPPEGVEGPGTNLKALFLHLPVAIVVFRPPEFRIAMVNQAYLAMIGRHDVADVVGKTLDELHPGVSSESIRSYLVEVCRRGVPLSRREHPLRLDGPDGPEERYFTNTFQPLFDEAGRVSRVVVTVTEVTEEVWARKSMAKSSERLRVVVDEMPVGVNVRDATTGEIVFGNKASTEILGLDVRERPSPDSWSVWEARSEDGTLLGPEDHAFRRVMRSGEPLRNQIVLLRQVGTGKEIVVRSSAAPIRGDGEVELVISVFEDITEEHALRAERDRTIGFAEKFVGVVGHDLRNPLGSLTTGLALLRRRAAGDAVLAKTVERMSRSTDRMTRMVDQLLDLTRARLGGGIPIERRPQDLVTIVQSPIDELAATHPRSVICRDLPPEVLGAWDGDRVAQVVSNLVGNALEHGDPERPVTVALNAGEDEVTLTVHSEGAPIQEELLPVLFDPFRRGMHGKRTSLSGLGLGLYITREIVVAHGGSVRAASTRADGTTFVVTLPRR